MVLDNLTVMSAIDELVDDVQSNSTNVTDFPDYDINDSFNHFEWAELAPVLVVYTLTFFLGLIGNVIIIASTLCRLRPLPATPTNVFLGGLATADLLLIIFCIPVKIAKLFSYTWTMGIFLCKAVHYMQSVSAICSVVTLTAMSIERYYAIVHPMRAQYICTISQARKIVIITWIAAFLLGVPMTFTQLNKRGGKTTHKEVGVRRIAYWCVRNSEAGLLWRSHEVYMLIVVLVLPLIIMAFCYTSICWEIWRVMKRRYHMTSRHALNPNSADTESIPMTQRQGGNERKSRRDEKDEESRTMKQVVKMLVAVVVLFAICWAPMLIDNVLTAYGYLPRVKSGVHKHLNTAFQLMAYFNSCINPIVYGFMSKHFRENFLSAACGGWWIFCPRRGYRASVTRNPSLSQTRSTSVSLRRTVQELYKNDVGNKNEILFHRLAALDALPDLKSLFSSVQCSLPQQNLRVDSACLAANAIGLILIQYLY
ncbi:Pyroglutamylated RFamide peptide receptor [Atta colombica]|uniref:Pyroglutamylated RFamide peptide receptor n=1 Tax=Atta colombica TaxID=520822 RepID=A0A195BFF7_9HYME|nr:Pyroglutamylated RFamide peptide receptor [Atta colombica]